MPDYHFTGAFPRLLAGLSQGVNAWLTPADEDPTPYGATLEAHTGDTVHTDEPYDHPELEEIEPAPDAEPAPVAAPAEPVVPIQLVAAPPAPPAPADPAPADPAHDTMTAEGAPAPAPTN